jgi:type II secretory pathway pseudopilin PulG
LTAKTPADPLFVNETACVNWSDKLEVIKRGRNFMATYIIIGGDGKEYGSVTEEQLRQWIANGRANASTQGRGEGATEWKSLAEFPELAAALQSAAPPLPRPKPTAVSASPPETSGMAITSLVLGILGVLTCGIKALAGLILGIVAMVKVKNSGGKLGGGGLALAGTIVSGIFLLFLFMIPILAAMLLPALAAAKQKAQEINCVNNEKQLALAVKMYSGNNNNHFPPAATWCDAIKDSTDSENIFKCPAADSSRRCDYAFNSKLDGMDASKINPQTVMIFESDTGWNANGGRELMITSDRHNRGRTFIVALADGSVQSVFQSQLNTLRWDP